MVAVLSWVEEMPDATVEGARSRACEAMDQYAGGRDAAFEVVYAELAPPLLAFAIRWCRAASAAEDSVQQTFLQMIRCRRSWIPGAAVRPWAFAILRRLLIDAGRRTRREVPGDGEVPERPGQEAAADDAVDARRDLAEVANELERLPPKLRDSFELVRIDGLPVAEAAEILGIAPGNVKIRVHRASRALLAARNRRNRRGP